MKPTSNKDNWDIVGCILYYLKFFLWLLTLTVTVQLASNQKYYQLSKPEIEMHMHMMERTVHGIVYGVEDNFLGKDN